MYKKTKFIVDDHSKVGDGIQFASDDLSFHVQRRGRIDNST
jgi:hypothetical protein